LEQQLATIVTNDNEEEDGNLIEMPAYLYVENEEVRDHILQQLHDLKPECTHLGEVGRVSP
jgi:hypothetical protein